MSWKATRNRLVALAALSCLLPGAAQAGWDAHVPQTAFVWHGKPVDPRCTSDIGETHPDDQPLADLAQCTRPGDVKREGNGYTVESRDPNGAMEYDTYEVLARDGMRFVLSLNYGGGGTGRFTGLFIMRLDGDKLVGEKFLSGGDRCNGGLTESSAKGHVVLWSENLTPPDLLALGGIAPPEPYAGLEASAMSCVATRDMEYDLDRSTPWLVSATLIGPLQDSAGWTEQYTEQHCFNLYFNKALTGGSAVLDPAHITAFAKGFERACPPPKQ